MKDKENIENNLCKYICEGITQALADRNEFDKLVDKWWNDWRDIKEEKLWPWRGCSNWSVPITSMTVDNIIPRIIEGIFDYDPPIEIKALNQTSEPFRDLVKAFLKWDLESHREIYEQIWFFTQNTVWSGTGFIKSYFSKERELQETREFNAYMIAGEIVKDPETNKAVEVNDLQTQVFLEGDVDFEIKTVTEKIKRWKKYNPELTTLDIKDVVFPSDTISIQDAWDNSFIAVRVWRTKDFLKRQLKQDEKALYNNLDKIKLEELKEEKADIGKKKIEFWEVYVNYDIDDDGFEEKIVALIHLKSKSLLGYEKFPYEHNRCPIIPGYIKPIHRKPYGEGIPESLYDIKGELDAIHNQRTDRNSLYINPILTHTQASGFDPNLHKVGPGRQWRLKDRTEMAIGWMAPMQTGADTNSFTEEQNILAYAQKKGRITDYSLGAESEIASNKTYGGIMALIREGNIGFRNYIRWMSLAMTEIFRQRLALYQQYWGKEADEDVREWIREILDIPDNPLNLQNIEAINKQYNIVMTATKEDKYLELTKAQIVYSLLNSNPLIQQDPTKLRDITIDLLRAIGITDPEKKIPTLEEIQAKQMTETMVQQPMRAPEMEEGYLEGIRRLTGQEV
jgi:hypothetical protein